jgi:histidyl-tRNA synthetase
VQIKDLILGASISQIKDRDEYKAAQAKAQYAVKEDQLVEEVRKLLAKHGVTWS